MNDPRFRIAILRNAKTTKHPTPVQSEVRAGLLFEWLQDSAKKRILPCAI